MLKRLTLAVLVTAAVAVGTVATWSALKIQNENQVARIAEAESYAARSQLIRHVETMLSAMENVRDYWAKYAHLPKEQWGSDASIELDHFNGIKMLIWDEPSRDIRFTRSSKNPVFDHRPNEEEWEKYQAVVMRARELDASTMEGPDVAEDGSVSFDLYMLAEGGEDIGRLAAVIDASELLKHMLLDESPGYSIIVSWGDVALYERGDRAAELPDSWLIEGKIKTTLGQLWSVTHLPTRDLAKSLTSGAVDYILLLGLLIAVLMGALTFEHGRARARAVEAEAAEKKLSVLYRDQEVLIEKRTKQLANRTADLQTITDSVAHDLRNPLNAISVNAQLIEHQYHDTLGSHGLKVLGRIPPSIRQMSEILDRLVGLSSVAHSTFEREELDMKKLVQDMFNDLIVSEPYPIVEIEIGDLPSVNADKKLTKMLLMNLIGNAIKYTREKEIRKITFDATQENGIVIYHISDTGIGFDQSSADRLFTAFHQQEDSSESEGIGLGLTLASRVVERHQGKIWAEGKLGKGASFYFSLEAD